MKAVQISIVLSVALSSSALGSDGRLQDWLNTGSWAKGAEYCNRELVSDTSRRPDLRSVSTEDLAELAVYCAALASGQEDEISSSWWWYTAASTDLKTAESLLPEMRKLGLLQVLPAPRSLGPSSARKVNEKREVRLVSGEIVPGTPLRLIGKPKIPDYMARPMAGMAMATVVIEAVVSRDGIPREPLLVKAQAHPVHILFAYYFFSTFRFEPAKVSGEPVECLYTLTVSFYRS